MVTARGPKSLQAIADEAVIAQRDALACALRDVLSMIDPKQHQWPDDQLRLNHARALVAEHAPPNPVLEKWLNAKERQ